jgi:HD-like signal output (HDOD) protein
MFEKVWRHSLGVAAVARRITMLQTDDEALAEEAFTAGLLHDIGKLILMSLKPVEYKETVRQSAEAKTPINLLERVKLGTTHAEIGGYLLSMWGIPFPILEAVAWHHFPGECKEKKFSPLTAVHIANIAEHRRTNRDNIKAVPPLDERYLEEVGVLAKVNDWLEITPEKARRNEPVGAPYVVRAAAPVVAPAQKTPAYVWVLLSIAAAAVLTAIASLFVR